MFCVTFVAIKLHNLNYLSFGYFVTDDSYATAILKETALHVAWRKE
jgi:hypothetical protein